MSYLGWIRNDRWASTQCFLLQNLNLKIGRVCFVVVCFNQEYSFLRVAAVIY